MSTMAVALPKLRSKGVIVPCMKILLNRLSAHLHVVFIRRARLRLLHGLQMRHRVRANTIVTNARQVR